MILKSKAAYGDDVDPPFPLGISSGFYVSKCVPARWVETVVKPREDGA